MTFLNITIKQLGWILSMMKKNKWKFNVELITKGLYLKISKFFKAYIWNTYTYLTRT